jgi:hypothetical protein
MGKRGAGGLFVGELREYLSRWDKATKGQREKMLAEFVKNSRNMTGRVSFPPTTTRLHVAVPPVLPIRCLSRAWYTASGAHRA